MDSFNTYSASPFLEMFFYGLIKTSRIRKGIAIILQREELN